MIDHRPYADHKRTPIGLCADAPLLILYPERGAVDWPALLHPIPLTNGVLFSGAPVWIVPLTPSQRTCLQTRTSVTLADLIAIASVSTP